MKSFSNTYIFIFSAVMVIIVATLLSFVAMQLKPIQESNITTEKMQNILHSVHIESTKKNAEELFNKYVTESYVINPDAQKIEGEVALDVNMKEEEAKIVKIKNLEASLQEHQVSPFKAFMSNIISFSQVNKADIQNRLSAITTDRLLPVYIVKKGNDTYYVVPLQGKGLWGPIWGFISLESDLNTIYGAVFDHKQETPGLGAEIKEGWFESEFNGKKLYENGTFRSVEVVKGGTSDSNPYGVDAVSGGTITSKGVQAMLYDCLSSYEKYFELQRK